MEIIKKLNLNKHPHACEDYSIVCAKNMKLSSDGRTLCNEEGLYNNVAIHNKLVEDFESNYKIVGVIPCNSELVIFVVGSDNEHGTIYRYDEQTDDCYKAYSKFVWQGGEIGGDFTYNVEGDLIICFGETNNDRVPYGQLGYGHELRTIKLHKRDDNHLDSDDIDWAKTPLCPEVPYCVCNELNWVEGHAYKGYYEFYIRYKIDDDNYTQWFYINGKPLVDEVNKSKIMNLIYAKYEEAHGDDPAVFTSNSMGGHSFTTSDVDYCNLSLELKLLFGNCVTEYNAFQLGYIITSKTYTKAFRTEDLDKLFLGATNTEYKFRVEHKNDIECTVEELTTSYYNYNNVENIVNYNNRIYISNYIETAKNINRHDLGSIGLSLDSAVSLSYKAYADSEVDTSIQIDTDGKYLDKLIDNKLDKRNTLLYGEVYDFYIHFVDKYGNVTNGIRLENTKNVSNRFEVFENNEGHKLFKVPDSLELTYQEEVTVYDEYGNPGTYVRTVTSKNPYLCLNFQINNIPSPYVAAFISYAKFEKRIKLTGIVLFNKLVNGYINVTDRLNLNANKLIDNYQNATYIKDKSDTFISANIDDELHIISVLELVDTYDSFDVDKSFLITADSLKNDNLFREGWVKLLFRDESTLPTSGMYNGGYIRTDKLFSLVYDHNDLYIGDNKQVVPTSAIVYKNYVNVLTNSDNHSGYNGFWCWDEFICYNTNGFILNSATGVVNDKSGYNYNEEYKSPIREPFVNYSIYYQWDYPLHIKKINNHPKVQFFANEIFENLKYPPILVESMVEPKDTIDLFVYPHPNKSEVMSNKYFSEYNPNASENLSFNKIVRRSNVIQNESLVNAWRQFPVEGYKLIDENKGDIVKIVAANQMFIVHCEHSIFVFDTTHKLQTLDKDVQLYQPDAFEVDYQELTSNDKGYAGLHDRHAAIFDTFGYIFYDRDTQTIYNYAGKQLKTIGAEIQNWLDNWRPTNCVFAVDKFNNRLLVRFDFHKEINDDTNYYESVYEKLEGKKTYPLPNTRATLSYSFISGTFISLHDYTFERGYNTKTKTYLVKFASDITDLAEFYKDSNFGEFHEVLPKAGADTFYYHKVGNIYESTLYIICNTAYEQIKFLEYIKYKLHKYTSPIQASANSVTIHARNNAEYRDAGWSGDYLLIFNKDCSTGKIDINVTDSNRFNRYKKPYYELSEWNFNYIRQSIVEHNSASPSDLHRRIYGNYFAIEFIFTNQDGLPIEFETLSCFFSKLRK